MFLVANLPSFQTWGSQRKTWIDVNFCCDIVICCRITYIMKSIFSHVYWSCHSTTAISSNKIILDKMSRYVWCSGPPNLLTLILIVTNTFNTNRWLLSVNLCLMSGVLKHQDISGHKTLGLSVEFVLRYNTLEGWGCLLVHMVAELQSYQSNIFHRYFWTMPYNDCHLLESHPSLIYHILL